MCAFANVSKLLELVELCHDEANKVQTTHKKMSLKLKFCHVESGLSVIVAVGSWVDALQEVLINTKQAQLKHRSHKRIIFRLNSMTSTQHNRTIRQKKFPFVRFCQ